MDMKLVLFVNQIYLNAALEMSAGPTLI